MNDGTDSVDTMMHIFFKCQIHHHRHRKIHTDRSSQQREDGPTTTQTTAKYVKSVRWSHE